MKKRFIFLNNYVMTTKVESNEYNGIVLPDNDFEKISKFKVVYDTSIKDEVNNIVFNLKKGDIILANHFDAIPFTEEGETYFVIKANSIIAIYNNEDEIKTNKTLLQS